ncbi:Mo-dependent nitrogenase C-terminal domain-containing protein [Oscillatoria sp. FACHB-1406]|uniref:Mo-dependent nitrogenase C-terminal domain-containing protein n=1 Tax=Oscillatoria sp. FACHB-1406 TaxID=2692846 RepID=UPI00168A3908|nr:Mo-dependent nitrogenase C-terminal domain-containing protein [Oscillatoria sp. FACHB-1406]MBD2579984.1 nitrogenase [Oscillatoria sp. FACHB-1406]
MASVAHFHYTTEQIQAWLRGLLTIAWADGQFDPEEQELMTQLTQDELAPATDLGELEVISPHELAAALGRDKHTAENFLRTAVMMALANGVYSIEEAKVINEFVEALGLEIQALKVLEQTLYDPDKHHCEGEVLETGVCSAAASPLSPVRPSHPHSDVLEPVRHWLDGMDIKDPRVARFVCKMIPPQCPFERDIKLFGRKIVHIPPMCKLNPLYEQLVGLRFRSLCYLADDCGEDVSQYC